jgi:hypothetical protein
MKVTLKNLAAGYDSKDIVLNIDNTESIIRVLDWTKVDLVKIFEAEKTYKSKILYSIDNDSIFKDKNIYYDRGSGGGSILEKLKNLDLYDKVSVDDINFILYKRLELNNDNSYIYREVIRISKDYRGGSYEMC